MNKVNTHKLVFTALMAAMVCVLTFFRFPFLGSKVHLANAMCLLSGLLLGGVGGGIAAGVGSGLYDALWGGYDLIQCVITVVSKFLMAYIAAAIANTYRNPVPGKRRIIVGSVVGALSYVALYMLKTFVYQCFVYGFPPETVWLTMLSKLPASLINAVFAMAVTPIIYFAIRPVFQRQGLLEKL